MNSESCSAFHACALGLISQFPDKHDQFWMENLFMSAKLCTLALWIPHQLNIHGVTRPTLRGVPLCMKQYEVKKKGDIKIVQKTVKVLVLWGDSICKDIVCVSIYDTNKLVHFLSTDCSKVKWILKHRKIFSKQNKQVLPMSFYRLNIVDYYNNNMGSVEITDQLSNVCRYDSQQIFIKVWLIDLSCKNNIWQIT